MVAFYLVRLVLCYKDLVYGLWGFSWKWVLDTQGLTLSSSFTVSCTKPTSSSLCAENPGFIRFRRRRRRRLRHHLFLGWFIMNFTTEFFRCNLVLHSFVQACLWRWATTSWTTFQSFEKKYKHWSNWKLELSFCLDLVACATLVIVVVVILLFFLNFELLLLLLWLLSS